MGAGEQASDSSTWKEREIPEKGVSPRGGRLWLQDRGVGDAHPSPFLKACPRVHWVTEGWTATFTEDLSLKKRSRRIPAESFHGLQEEKWDWGQGGTWVKASFALYTLNTSALFESRKKWLLVNYEKKKICLAWKGYSGNGYYNYYLKQRERHLTQHKSTGRKGPCWLPSSLCSGPLIPGPSSNVHPKADALTALTARPPALFTPCFRAQSLLLSLFLSSPRFFIAHSTLFFIFIYFCQLYFYINLFLIVNFIIFYIYLFLIDDCFTILVWSVSYIYMN